MIEALVTGAAIGIVGCLGGQGMMMRLQQFDAKKLESRLAELEAKELVVRNDFIGRAEVQQALDGFAKATQQVLVEQGEGVKQLIAQSAAENAKVVRVAEARAQATAPMQPAMSVGQVQDMMARFEQLERQIGG